MIKLGNVKVSDKTKAMIAEALDDGKIGQSEYIEQFEEEFAKFFGVKYAIAVSNGTVADTIALAVLKNTYPDKKKVIVPALTFIAQINAVLHNGLEPVFYDVDEDIEPLIDEDTLCVFPVHLLGVPEQNFVDVSVPVVEDACEAMGSSINGKYCGTMGDLGAFSFYPSHTIATGEGGMVVTNNKKYAKLARRLRNHGETENASFKFDVIGFNGKMPSLQAILGLGQMDNLQEMIERRHDNFITMGGKEDDGEYVVPHGFSVFSNNRDEKMKELKKKGIDCRRFFSSVPTQEKAYEFLGHKEGEFPSAEYIGKMGLYVPCHQYLTDEEVEYIKANI